MNSFASHDLRGLWVPVITPFNTIGAVDHEALGQLSDRLLADGVAGLVALGTTGEPATLSAKERCRVVEICSQRCEATDQPLIVGAGTNGTQSTIDEIEMLTANTSAQAALIVVPYYTRPSQVGLVNHFQEIADASRVPIILYNVPYRTGRALDPNSIVELASHPNVIGLKQSVGQLDQASLQILRQRLPDFSVLAGDDAYICPTVLMGGHGAISAAAHMCTPSFVEMVTASLAHKVDHAVRLAENLFPVVEAGFAEPSPSVWKGALHQLGELTTGEVRSPMVKASETAIAALIENAQDALNGGSQYSQSGNPSAVR